MDILQQVKGTIDKHKMLKVGESILVALSGGVDSVALLHVLCALKKLYDLRIFAAHVNHHLRDNADRDAEFVRTLCNSFGVTCFVKDADVRKIAAEQGISEELAGREVRYAFFDTIRLEHNIDKIATAHQKNDVAETVLMHLIRGSGIDGLSGIPYVRGAIIRPLLDCSKAELEAYCETEHLSYVVDETNFEPTYTRNKVRLELMQSIENINPGFSDTIVRNAALYKEDADVLNSLAQEVYEDAFDGVGLMLERLQGIAPAIKRRVLQAYYKAYTRTEENPESKHIEAVLQLIESGKTGKSIDIAKGVRARVEYGRVVLEQQETALPFSYTLLEGIPCEIPELGAVVTVTQCDNGCDNDGRFYFSADTQQTLIIRSRRDGDGFYPVGMEGRKKLSDFFTDSKIPQNMRDRIGLLEYGGDLVWVIGKRRDRRYLFENDKKFTYAVDISYKM